MSFAAIALKNTRNVYLVQGVDTAGREAFYYLKIDLPRKAVFLEKIKEGNIDLRDYGQILGCGFGANPTKAALAQLKQKYGIDGNF